ncbi:hypothetical protein AYI69_g4230 [Smittium culicis]|uniref:Uncharacterized protein n=1 Tax=Smittium culicis TaxID=133412 RepID=A0A1R1YFM3_9FUNG|nr:hypothetical protein AYI69_g4230 [Smittium culicis]
MPDMNISPVIEFFREWGENSSLTTKKIAAKLCWQLSVTRFLRAREIRRVDDQRFRIYQDILNLVLVDPKEKRGGRQIENQFQINPHTDIILLLVNSYIIYKEKVKFIPCPTSQIKIYQKIHPFDSELILLDPEALITKMRAIGSTLSPSSVGIG